MSINAIFSYNSENEKVQFYNMTSIGHIESGSNPQAFVSDFDGRVNIKLLCVIYGIGGTGYVKPNKNGSPIISNSKTNGYTYDLLSSYTITKNDKLTISLSGSYTFILVIVKIYPL